jgi:hypothetical protein
MMISPRAAVEWSSNSNTFRLKLMGLSQQL